MLINVIIFLLSVIPSVLIFVWLRNRHADSILYKNSCRYALVGGAVSVLPILLLSAILFIVNAALKLTLLKDANVLIYQAIYKFIVLAFAEEIVKFITLKIVLKKSQYPYSWADVTALMVIIGTVFGLMEDLPYAIGATPAQMLVRGFTMGHVGYGFIMGWFYGKRLYTVKKRYGVIAVLLPWLIHGLYDFSLTPELLEFNDNFMLLALLLAALDVVLLILMIRFFIKARKKDFYNEPVPLCEKTQTVS